MVGPLLNVVASLQVVPPGVFLENLTGQGIRVDWEIEKCVGPSPNTCNLVIYNLNMAQRETIGVAMAAPIPLQVSLQIGWQGLAPVGVPEIVFIGQVWEAEATKKENTDIITLLRCGDGSKPLSETPPPGGSAAALGFQAVVLFLLGEMKLVPTPAAQLKIAEQAAKLPLPSFQFTGDEPPKEYLNEVLASLGLSWGIQDGLFVVYQGGLLPTGPGFPTPLLAPRSGLLSWIELDDGSLRFQALAQPAVQPGSAVIFQDELEVLIGGAPMRIERIEFTGSTMGESMMSGIARRLQVF